MKSDVKTVRFTHRCYWVILNTSRIFLIVIDLVTISQDHHRLEDHHPWRVEVITTAWGTATAT